MTGAIRCDDVWKRYRRGSRNYRTLREDLAAFLGRSRPARPTAGDAHYVWALQEVSLQVESGEALGILGPNGSGKSTLLKLLAGVTFPTQGEIEVRGRIGPLIEVGAGIHPELTGRENIYLQGTAIGLSRGAVVRTFDQIVAFAGLEQLLDVPVKRYSSGMKIRLGFAIAAHTDPDILLVDEVLAVGDAAFQRRCLERIKTMLESGVTILFVSHELSSLERLCSRALWLERGRIRRVGPSGEIVRAYLDDVESRVTPRVATGFTSPGGVSLDPVALLDRAGRTRSYLQSGDSLTVALPYRCPPDFQPRQVAFKVLDERMGTIAVAIWEPGDGGQGWPGSRGTIRCTFETLPLSPRLYQVWAQILRGDMAEEVPWTLLAAFPVIDGVRPQARALAPARGREAPLLTVPSSWDVTASAAIPAGPEGVQA